MTQPCLTTAWRSLRAFVLLPLLLLTGCATALSQSEAQAVAGKTYVVTGASSGFGRGVALKLGAMRANVVLAARRTQVLEEVAAQVALVQTCSSARMTAFA